MKAGKANQSGNTITRFEPIDQNAYPERVEDGIDEYYRFYCGPLFIVYEKYRNGIKLGYYILPTQKEIFTFNGMVDATEKITSGSTLCQPVR